MLDPMPLIYFLLAYVSRPWEALCDTPNLILQRDAAPTSMMLDPMPLIYFLLP